MYFWKQQFLVRYFVKNFKSVRSWTLYCYSQFLQNMRQVFISLGFKRNFFENLPAGRIKYFKRNHLRWTHLAFAKHKEVIHFQNFPNGFFLVEETY